jgi:hypothetical protein
MHYVPKVSKAITFIIGIVKGNLRGAGKKGESY